MPLMDELRETIIDSCVKSDVENAQRSGAGHVFSAQLKQMGASCAICRRNKTRSGTKTFCEYLTEINRRTGDTGVKAIFADNYEARGSRIYPEDSGACTGWIKRR